MAQAVAKAEEAAAELIMGKTEARRLTADIKRTVADVQQRGERLRDKLIRAFREGAWKALGYDSFQAYIAAEFPEVSRGQGYRLVAWGEVTAELEAATGGPVEVSGRQAAAVRGKADEVAAKIRERLAEKRSPTAADRREATEAALAETAKPRARAEKPPDPPSTAPAPAAAEAEQTVPAPTAPPAPPSPADGQAGGPPAPPGPTATVTAMTMAGTAPALVAALLASDPADAVDVPVEDIDRLAAWIGRVRKAKRDAGKPTQQAPAAKAEQRPGGRPRAAEVKAGDCKHPVGQRIGPTCMACGTAVGKAS